MESFLQEYGDAIVNGDVKHYYTISKEDSKVSSAAGIAFEPIEYKINPKHTNVPCNENIELL